MRKPAPADCADCELRLLGQIRVTSAGDDHRPACSHRRVTLVPFSGSVPGQRVGPAVELDEAGGVDHVHIGVHRQ